MRKSTALGLNRLNTSFYLREATSFSATRQVSWPGWGRCLDVAESTASEDACPARPPQALSVLDVACGNLRFARFLAQRMPGRMVSYCGVDNNQQLAEGLLAPDGWDIHLEERDIVGSLLGIGRQGKHAPAQGVGSLDKDFLTQGEGAAEEHASTQGEGAAEEYASTQGEGALRQEVFPGETPRGALGVSNPADLTVCFGFFHHVPTFEARVRLMQGLLAATRPGGVCCVSFWRFMSEPGLATKARATTTLALESLGLTAADLDGGDFLLGWQSQPGVYRYCHSFDDDEVDRFLAAVDASVRVVDRFVSDGRSGSLNEYLVLQT